jgi:propionyl-CoA carboxylase alpha chain
MFDKILIANRGEIALRVMRACRELGIHTVAVHSTADEEAMHVRLADESVCIGPPPARDSYLNIPAIVAACEITGAEAVHPGYGFLSENARFAEILEEHKIKFIGPSSQHIRIMGDKIEAKRTAKELGIPVVPGSEGGINDLGEARRVAKDIGYPVLIKATAGGGGRGMKVARSEAELENAIQTAQAEAKAAFGNGDVYLEKYLEKPRHIEIQVLGDQHGNTLYLGERECSIQRRNQKVVEEAPSSFLDEATGKAMGEQAVLLAKAVGYFSAGTVEFIVDGKRNFYFLEMNTRLQVEHPVTELVTGIDLVEQMIRVANGEKLAMTQADIRLDGWAMESRLYAEDPYRGFLPSIGRLTRYRPPVEGQQPDGTVIRNDTGVQEGGEISMYYDPMIAKLCTWAPDRPKAIEAMAKALDRFEVEGIGHNLPFLSAVMAHPRFYSGSITTAFIAEEWPEGFHGVSPDNDQARQLASVATYVHLVEEARRTKISGTLANHTRKLGNDFVAVGGDHFWPQTVTYEVGVTNIAYGDDITHTVESDWLPGATLSTFVINGQPLSVKISRASTGWRLRFRGVDLVHRVMTPRVFELSQYMPVKQAADTSKQLLCPMPGVITQVLVSEGATVEAGQPLATVEAMKMENMLKAEKKSVVKAIKVEPGQSLAVDEVIMEFE